MALIDEVKTVCDRLASLGWRNLLLRVSGNQLDLVAESGSTLATVLSAELQIVDRSVPGFEDFAREGRRGIEPGSPARSLLYHALTSPNVLERGDGNALTGFPTPAEIEVVENYVFGVRTPSFQDIHQRAGAGNPVAIVVFAYEYRPAPETVHRRHADMCLSRTGVARVGTAEAIYDPARRGFTPVVEGKPHEFAVLPARYATFLAVQLRGAKNSFGPMRFHEGGESDDDSERPSLSDVQRRFWVPLHKLFSGRECLLDFDLDVELVCRHVNEKLRRIHLEFGRAGIDAGWHEPKISSPPFLFTDGIAEFSQAPQFGRGLLVPTVHSALVEVATREGKPVSYRVAAQGSANVNGQLVPSTLFFES